MDFTIIDTFSIYAEAAPMSILKVSIRQLKGSPLAGRLVTGRVSFCCECFTSDNQAIGGGRWPSRWSADDCRQDPHRTPKGRRRFHRRKLAVGQGCGFVSASRRKNKDSPTFVTAYQQVAYALPAILRECADARFCALFSLRVKQSGPEFVQRVNFDNRHSPWSASS